MQSQHRQYSTNLRSRVTLLLVAATLAGCAHQIVEDLSQESVRYSSTGAVMQTRVSACRDSLARPAKTDSSELDRNDIRVFNWNIQKNRAINWREDYASYTDEMDLVLIQEVSLRHDSASDLRLDKHISFTPGYRRQGEVTGVLTLSNIEPLTQCSFINLEPIIKTPKTTNVTQFALSATDETLIVVNLHAVNFSWGLGAFSKQFDEIVKTLRDHSGPIIVSGDFNTWRKKRVQIVEQMAESLGLTPVEFIDDHRKRAFGNYLDHIYVRGLSALESATRAVSTSDHNPMSVTLGVTSAPSVSGAR